MTINGKLTVFSTGSPANKRVLDIFMPPVVLPSTTAAALNAALKARLPVPLDDLAARARDFTLVMNTDSARACKLLARQLAMEHVVLHAPCLMHQLCICLVAVLRLSGVMSAMFCATLTLHRKRVQTLLRRELAHQLQDMECTFASPADDAELQHIADMFLLMEQVIASGAADQDSPDAGQSTKRMKALRRLAGFFAGGSRGSRVRHHCPLGCHLTKADAIQDLCGLIDEVWLNHPPCIPAWNKWTKIWPVLVWYVTFLACYTLLPDASRALCTLVDHEDLDFTEDSLCNVF